MNIDYYAPNTTKHYRTWAAAVIHTEFPMADMVAVHAEHNVAHCTIDVDDMDIRDSVQLFEFTASLKARYRILQRIELHSLISSVRGES